MENLPRVAVFGQPGSKVPLRLLPTGGKRDHWSFYWAVNWGIWLWPEVCPLEYPGVDGRRGKWARGQAMARVGSGTVWAERGGVGGSRTPRPFTPGKETCSPALEGSCCFGWDPMRGRLGLHSASLFISVWTHTLSPECITLLRIWTPAFQDRQWARSPGHLLNA